MSTNYIYSNVKPSNRQIHYIDLFAGCGGLSLGLKKAKIQGVFAIEKNPDAYSTLKTNLIDNNHFLWPDWMAMKNWDIYQLLETHSGDLKKLQGTIDLVVGGPPCQGFSMAGKRNANDVRNKLCFSYLEFIKLVRPNTLCFENVQGFTQSFAKKPIDKNSKTNIPFSEKIITALYELGYNVSSRIINVSDYGVPQNRKRFIIIASLFPNPTKVFESLDINKKQFMTQKKIKSTNTVSDAISDLLRSHGECNCEESNNFKSGIYGQKFNSGYQRLMRQGVTKKSPNSHRFVRHMPETIVSFQKLMKYSDKMLRITPKHQNANFLKKRSITPLKADEICGTITSIPDDFIHYQEPRVLTVREMARIQSFPDSYEFKGKYTTGGDRRVFEVPRYTQVANAVPPLFSEQLGIALRGFINDFH